MGNYAEVVHYRNSLKMCKEVQRKSVRVNIFSRNLPITSLFVWCYQFLFLQIQTLFILCLNKKWDVLNDLWKNEGRWQLPEWQKIVFSPIKATVQIRSKGTTQKGSRKKKIKKANTYEQLHLLLHPQPVARIATQSSFQK